VAAIERTDEFERWWAWLGEFRLHGPSLQRGSVMIGVVNPPLPYRIRVDLEDCVRPATIDAAVHGDLVGRAHLALESDGDGTLATAAWTIETLADLDARSGRDDGRGDRAGQRIPVDRR
jgi:hypothetical protein